MGLAPSATAEEIDDQYRALAKVVHPDVGGDAIMFMVLDEAYDVLSDPIRRAAYDRSLASPSARPAQPPPAQPAPQPAFYPDGTPRVSTPAQRAEAQRRAKRGHSSWHLTPSEHFKAGLRGLAIRLALVGIGLFIAAIVALIRGG